MLNMQAAAPKRRRAEPSRAGDCSDARATRRRRHGATTTRRE